LSKDRVVCGTWQYWFLVLSVVPLILVITAVVRNAHPCLAFMNSGGPYCPLVMYPFMLYMISQCMLTSPAGFSFRETGLRDLGPHAGTVQVRAVLVRDFYRKQSSGYVWTEGDVEWNERNTILFPALSSLAGLIAGMFGVGGWVLCWAASLHALPAC
jgi:hypothetical protein